MRVSVHKVSNETWTIPNQATFTLLANMIQFSLELERGLSVIVLTKIKVITNCRRNRLKLAFWTLSETTCWSKTHTLVSVLLMQHARLAEHMPLDLDYQYCSLDKNHCIAVQYMFAICSFTRSGQTCLESSSVNAAFGTNTFCWYFANLWLIQYTIHAKMSTGMHITKNCALYEHKPSRTFPFQHSTHPVWKETSHIIYVDLYKEQYDLVGTFSSVALKGKLNLAFHDLAITSVHWFLGTMYNLQMIVSKLVNMSGHKYTYNDRYNFNQAHLAALLGILCSILYTMHIQIMVSGPMSKASGTIHKAWVFLISNYIL